MPIKFTTKAETLESTGHILTTARVLPQIRFTIQEWRRNVNVVINRIKARFGLENSLIVRSSNLTEDSDHGSLAGQFTSVADVYGELQLKDAIEKVALSFGESHSKDQIFIQPMLQNVIMSGVAFTHDPNTGGHYYIISYDDHSGLTDSVTSGFSNKLKTFYYDKVKQAKPDNEKLFTIISLLDELEKIFSMDTLDVEFAVTENNDLYLLQVRPLVMPVDTNWSMEKQRQVLSLISRKIECLNQFHPYLYGSRTVFGIMPDWNPAEIIGVRPKPLDLSFYKNLITDSIWAYQRDNYGYRNLRSFPLLINFGGLPYIDVRVSFNSFIPADIDNDLANRLVNYYIDRLIETPSYHDKVEFEIIFSCYTLDLPEKLKAIKDHGFSGTDCKILSESLRTLTNNIIHEKSGLWRQDIQKIRELKKRQQCISESKLDPVTKIYWMLEDCKRYGTLPFAGLARAGFIAVQLLSSMMEVGILNEQDYERFMRSLDTIRSQMTFDFLNIDKKTFLSKYGHLRPGTYNILSMRYDETPDYYFDWSQYDENVETDNQDEFSMSLLQMNELESSLKKHGLEQDVISLLNFIKGAIEGREYSKFVFTKSISDVMLLFVEFASQFDISRDELSFADIGVIERLHSSCDDPENIIRNSIIEGREKYETTCRITLPPLINSSKDVFAFHLPVNSPNYITLKTITAKVATEDIDHNSLHGSILMIPNADPGYDWIFTHGVGGLITMYGGVNSHMAIRAGELGIPAVIGAGETLYFQWCTAKILKVDCANRQVRILK